MLDFLQRWYTIVPTSVPLRSMPPRVATVTKPPLDAKIDTRKPVPPIGKRVGDGPFYTGLKCAKDYGPIKCNRKWPTGKHRGFVFTNHQMDWNWEEAKEWNNVTFLSIGDEIAPTTGKRHHQGAVYFKNPRTCAGFAKLLPAGTWLMPAKGNEFQNEKYTQKESTLLVIGAPAEQGKRWDIEDIRMKIVDEGATPAVVACETGMTYNDIKFAEAVFRLAGGGAKRAWKSSVVWIWGESGKGKSHVARMLMRETDPNEIWTSAAKLDYWQQYQGQSTVWLDEFRGDKCTFTNLLQILDSSPFEVNVKYGSHQLLAERIIITSSMHPKDAYPGCSENLNQLLRRIEVLWNIDELYAACAAEYKFPEVPFFDNFGATMYMCSESKLSAKNPIRYEGTKCLELVNNEWIPCAEQKVLASSVPALGVKETVSRQARVPLTKPAVPEQKSGVISGHMGTSQQSCSGPAGPDLVSLHSPPYDYDRTTCLDDYVDEILERREICPHEKTAITPASELLSDEDGLDYEQCLNCGLFVDPKDGYEGDESDASDDSVFSRYVEDIELPVKHPVNQYEQPKNRRAI